MFKFIMKRKLSGGSTRRSLTAVLCTVGSDLKEKRDLPMFTVLYYHTIYSMVFTLLHLNLRPRLSKEP